MKHFTDKELCCKCCGRLPPKAKENLESLVDNVLDPVRELYGSPIHVSSAFRCPLHNAAVGGVAKSQHIAGEAADITAGSPGGNLKVARLIVQLGNYDQLILYVNNGSTEPQFIHGLGMSQSITEGAAAWVHCREKDNDFSVSTQYLFVDPAVYANYQGQEALNASVNSYGGTSH